jgi:hypothetical protein
MLVPDSGLFPNPQDIEQNDRDKLKKNTKQLRIFGTMAEIPNSMRT